MDGVWPLTRERHTTNCPAFVRSTTVSEGGGWSYIVLAWWSVVVSLNDGRLSVLVTGKDTAGS
jgi:hypothetical protein